MRDYIERNVINRYKLSKVELFLVPVDLLTLFSLKYENKWDFMEGTYKESKWINSQYWYKQAHLRLKDMLRQIQQNNVDNDAPCSKKYITAKYFGLLNNISVKSAKSIFAKKLKVKYNKTHKGYSIQTMLERAKNYG
jgi:hypothetical protein